MDIDELSQPFERQPTKLVVIDAASGEKRAYQASPDGKPPKQIDQQGKDPSAA